jgi:urease accessory protein
VKRTVRAQRATLSVLRIGCAAFSGLGLRVTNLRVMAPRVCAQFLMALALLLSGSPAEAHLVTTGLGPVYDGISHFLMSPEDLVPVFALALLAGQCGRETARGALFALPAGWFAGGLTASVVVSAPPPNLTWLIFVLLGVLVAAHLRPPQTAVMLLASALGFFNGFLNGSAISSAGTGVISLVGVVAAVFVVMAFGTAAVIAWTWPAAKIGFRVLGSWTAATGILLLGWSLR